jgi:hypothetical protein
MKTKGQPSKVAKLELLALVFSSLGEVPERLNGPVCKTVKGLATLAGSNPALSARSTQPHSQRQLRVGP